MKRLLLLLIVTYAPPSLADESRLYVSLGAGGAVLATGAYGNGIGSAAEARVGYRFSPLFELCLSGNYATANLTGYRVHLVEALVGLQYHFVRSQPVEAYVRGGLGSGLGAREGGGVSNPGVAFDLGLGLDLAAGANFRFGPQVFYRHMVVAGTPSYPGSVLYFASGGLQLNVSYY